MSRKNEYIKYKEEKKEERRRRDIERRKLKEESRRIKRESKEPSKVSISFTHILFVSRINHSFKKKLFPIGKNYGKIQRRKENHPRQ